MLAPLQSDSEHDRYSRSAHSRPQCVAPNHSTTRITRTRATRTFTISCGARPRGWEACVGRRVGEILHGNPGRRKSRRQVRVSRELGHVEAHPVVRQVLVHGGNGEVSRLCHEDECVAVGGVAYGRRGLEVWDGVILGDLEW
jgi:hypothetical protein